MTNIYVNIPGFVGTVKAANFTNQLEVFEPGFLTTLTVSNAIGSGVNRVSGVPMLGDFTFKKKRDGSSIKFWSALFNKSVIPTIQINWVETDKGGYAYRIITLTSGVVSSFESSMDGQDLIESGSINFTEIQIKDNTMDKDGTPIDSKTASYDGTTLTTK